jgi:long-chain acyl-CoA synthetase
VLVPLNARHTDAELSYALEDAGASVLFSTRPPQKLPACVEHVVGLDESFEALLGSSSEGALDACDGHGLAGLFYTGGTTGASKGVMLSHGNLVANAMNFMACWRFEPTTRWLVAAPMFHAAGTIGVLATVWAAGTHVILPTFAADCALDLIESERVTHTLFVPTMLAAVADEQTRHPRKVSSLRYISHGGAPIATETLRRGHAAFPEAELLHIYGATETAPIVTLSPHEDQLLEDPRSRSCGQAAVGVELSIKRADGRLAPVDEVGEVAIRGPNVMTGYWNKATETTRALVDGWYMSGDLGYLDSEGYLFLVDRAKDMIVTGGENVYSSEVEEALFAHKAVLEAAVFGIPSARWGEAVHAIVVPREPVTETELVRHCRELIADYKVPKSIDIRTEPLPRSGAAKILKRDLREPFWRERKTRVSGS